MKDRCLRDKVHLFASIVNEHKYQISKWGVQDHDLFKWLAFLTEEVGELSEAISENEWRMGSPDYIYKEAIQVATLALKIAEMSCPRMP